MTPRIPPQDNKNMLALLALFYITSRRRPDNSRI